MAELDTLEIVIETVANNAQSSLTSIEQGLERMGEQLDKTNNKSSNTFNAFKTNIDQVNVQINNTTVNMNKLAKQSKLLSSTTSMIFGKFLSIAMLKKLGQFFQKAYLSAANYIETLNLFGVTFSKLSDQDFKGLTDWTQSVADSFGFDVASINKTVGTLNQMAISAGLATEEALQLSKAMTALSLDISSLYNLSQDEVFSKIQSTLAGVPRAFQQQGLAVYASDINQFLKEELGIQDKVNTQLSQQERYMVRAILLIRKAENAWGNLADEINEPIQQIKIFQEQMQLFVRNIGNFILGMFSGIVPYINGLLMAVNSILSAVGSLLGYGDILQGITGGGGDDPLKQLEEMEKSIDGLINGVDKFTTLGNSGGSNPFGIDAKIEDAFMKQIKEYLDAFNKAMDEINQKSISIRNNILQWIFPNWDKESKSFQEYIDGFKDTNAILEDMNSGLASIINFFIALKEAIKPIVDLFKKLNIDLEFIGDVLLAVIYYGIDSLLRPTLMFLQIFSGIITTIKELRNNINLLFSQLNDGTLNFGQFILRVMINVANGFLNIFFTIIDTIVNIIINAINAIINPFGKLISKIFGLDKIAIPNFEIPKNVIPVPQLADGGIAYGRTLAEVGEYNGVRSRPEVIAPLNHLQGIMSNTITESLSNSGVIANNSYMSQEYTRGSGNIILDGYTLARRNERNVELSSNIQSSSNIRKK